MPELIFSADGSGRLSLPDRCTVNVECLERPEVQQAVMQVLEEGLYVAAFAGIDLKALDGITVPTDCRAAACALQNLTAGQVALEMKEQPDALELARTAAVRRNGDLRFHIVVRPGLLLLALSADQEMQRLAQACLAHEAAHVDHESHLYRMFPESYGKPLECGDRSRKTYLKAMDVWSEYAACRSSAMFRPEAIEEFEGILCRALEDSPIAAIEQIQAHREGRSAGDVFREIQQIFGDAFIHAGYLLGHIHGLERRRKDCTRRLNEILRKNPELEPLMERLERVLHELWLQEYAWPSIEVFAPIYDLICERMSQCGLIFVRHNDEWRIVMYEERDAREAPNQAVGSWSEPYETP